MEVRGSASHLLRSAPSDTASKILNEKATAALGEKHYHSIDSSTRVQIQCVSGDWAKVQLTEPEWLRDVGGWVKRDALLEPRAPGEFRTFTDADVIWDRSTKDHKAMILAAVNRIHREDSRCNENINVANVMLSTSQSKPGKPVFFVQCEYHGDTANVFFNGVDVEAKKPFAAPVHIERARAVDLCEAYAKQNATHPSTVDSLDSWISP